MSVSTATKGGPTFQPYQCHVCQSRFTRHENLKRHATLHSRPRRVDSLSCAFCQATFSRPDLRTRHMKRKHPEQDASQWSSAASRTRASGQDSGAVPRTVSTDGASPTSPSSVSPTSVPFASDSHVGSWQIYGSSDEGAANRTCPESASNYPNSTPGSSPAGDDGHSAGAAGFSPGSHPHSRPGLPITHHHRSQYQHSRSTANTSSPDHLEAHPLHAPFSPSRTISFDPGLAHFDFSLPQPRDSWLPSASQVNNGIQLYFSHVSHFVPFFHQPTFDVSTTTDFLRLAMLCLAYQYGEDPDRSYDEDSGAALSVRCYHRTRALVAMAEEDPVTCGDPRQTLAIVQAYLLLEIFAMLYLPSGDASSRSESNNTSNSSGSASRFNASSHSISTAGAGATSARVASISSETATTSVDGTAMHARLIALARAGGLMQPLPAEPMATQDLQSLWVHFVKNESHKRTLFAVHQLDALWYQLLSIPRSISHLEIKHDLPCPEDYWAAPSAAEWAHRKLMSGSGGGSSANSSPVSYAEAVRRFLSSDADSVVMLPPFDAYGAINIAQFLISSAREISGWSTITGVLSLERLQPLKSSLIALSPSIHPQPDTAKATHAALMCEAIWEIAMIELQLWSPAHTDGIVRGSIDDLLRQSTQLPPLSRFLYESTTIQPHVDWFLHYLEASVSPSLEAPWIPLYAYKVFLIAYQLVCEGIAGAMQVVGVEDGDARGALLWAEKVFRRRRRWHLGRVILDCLGRLERPE